MKLWKKEPALPGGAAAERGRPPAKLGGFTLERELGRGATGTVYLGIDPASGRKAAIKTLRLVEAPDAALQGAFMSRILHEARVLAWLDHPDIVAIYDVGEQHGLVYIAMEYVHGVELDEFSEPRKLLPPQTVLEIGARVADALGYAHEQNITHCDVKPANVMYDAASNIVKVMDFGIARIVSLVAPRTRIIMGSAPYMSPEQVLGKPVSGASDLFSLGSTLYKLLSARLPFEADSPFDVFSHIVQDPHTDISSFKPELPPCVRDIINRALSKHIEDRFQTGYQMADAIRHCAQSTQHL